MSATTGGSHNPALSEEGMVARFLRATEIDTPEDYERALEWMRVHRDAWGG